MWCEMPVIIIDATEWSPNLVAHPATIEVQLALEQRVQRGHPTPYVRSDPRL